MESNKDFTGSARYESDRDAHSVEPKDTKQRPEQTIDPIVEEVAQSFYSMFSSACHGISLRQELEQLYNATFNSFMRTYDERPEFSKVLFAMARSLKVLRVIKGGTISWKALNRPRYDDHQDDRRPRFDDRRQDDHRPRFDDRRQDDHRPRFDDRRQDDQRPRFDDRRQDNHRPRFDDRRQDNHRPRFDDRRQDDRRARFDDRRRDEQQPTREPLRPVSVERQ